MSYGVEIIGVSKRFGEGPNAVKDVSLQIKEGSFVSLLGPSGCGKTTTLRMIAGLETPDDGDIRILGRTVFSRAERTDVAPNRRPVGFVFQSYALWPHMTVQENLAYPLARAKVDKRTAAESVASTLRLLKCEQIAQRYPAELSGGQQQRVALGRAIVNSRNQIVLFDEPLSNLDAKLREELRFELRALQEDLGFTAIYVTHDQAEAMSMSDHVVVMRTGEVELQGDPERVFHQPVTRYVANFFGAYNILDGRVTEAQAGGGIVADTALGTVTADGGAPAPQVGDTTCLALPIDGIELSPAAPTGTHFAATVVGLAYYGNYSDIRLEVGDGPELRCRVWGGHRFSRGQPVFGQITGPAVVLRD